MRIVYLVYLHCMNFLLKNVEIKSKSNLKTELNTHLVFNLNFQTRTNVLTNY